ncbi:MAG: hypothetical protein MRY49_00235 [Candidatus Pacebacteria bacterium]|nr:hypothetical protein [Candidatus Paceibacterota bacterium]
MPFAVGVSEITRLYKNNTLSPYFLDMWRERVQGDLDKVIFLYNMAVLVGSLSILALVAGLIWIFIIFPDNFSMLPIWVMLGSVCTLFFVFSSYHKKVERHENACTDIYASAGFVAKYLEFDSEETVLIGTYESLKGMATECICKKIKVLIDAEKECQRHHLHEKKYFEAYQVARNDLARTFNAMKSLGLTEEDWEPYFKMVQG